MITINDYLDEVLDDFKEYVKSQEQLCALLNVHFDAGKVPDYSDIHTQQLYLLRYAYGYAFEYKQMYKSLLNQIGFNKNISVTSIGCGTLIDYWALVRVVGKQSSIHYRGIDVIDWNYKIEPRSVDDVRVFCADAVDYLDQKKKLSSDIYIFPKSISEFSSDDISKIAEILSSEKQKKDSIHIMFSLRTKQKNLEEDAKKSKMIYDKMIQSGYKSSSQRDKYTHFDDSIQGKMIRSIDNDFLHPSDEMDYLKHLYLKCRKIDCCEIKTECEDRLGRKPVLSCSYAAWKIFSFQREE